jgi:DNA-binding MarR family transcriptional regulator
MLEHASPDITHESLSEKPLQNGLQWELEKLLAEVNALAIRLRQDARRVQVEGNLPPGGHNVLMMLRRFGSLTVPQMARLDSTSRQNIQAVVNRLEREGCVESAPNPAHKRSELVRLTGRGMASSEMISRNAQAYRYKLLSHLSQGELTRATELLRNIREGMTVNSTTPVGNGLADVRPGVRLSKPKKRERPSFEPRAQTAKQEAVLKEPAFSEENELPVSLL